MNNDKREIGLEELITASLGCLVAIGTILLAVAGIYYIFH
jgi:hypothetical protein